MDSPFDLFEVHSKDFRRQQEIDTFSSCTLQPRLNALGTGEFAVPADSPALQYLERPGARIVARYRGEHLMSGWIVDPRGDWSPDGEVRFQIEDDWSVLQNALAWPVPAGNLRPTSLSDLGQARRVSPANEAGGVKGQSGYYRWPDATRTAETAIKQILRDNLVSRLRVPITIATDRARGGDVRAAGLLTDGANVRFNQLDEAIAPLLAASGLVLRIWQDPAINGGLQLDVFEPHVWPQQLTLASGILTEGSWTRDNATATRYVIGGPGEDAARVFYEKVDTTLEARTGRIIERFKDATQTEFEWPEEVEERFRIAKYAHLRTDVPIESRRALLAGLQAAATKALAESSDKVGLGVKLAETESFHFHGPDGVHLGDTLEVARLNDDDSETPFVDRLTGATISVGDSGVQITPELGEIVDDEDDEVWDYLSRLSALFQESRRK